MILPKFGYLRPSSLEEARRLLDMYGARARLVGGGTDLFPRLKYYLERPEVLISLKALEAQVPYVATGNQLALDAFMTLTAVTRSADVLGKIPLLAEAAKCVASYEIRNMGTLGGNLCQESRCLYYNQRHRFQFAEPCFKRGGDLCYFVPKSKKCFAVYMSDTAPALMCLDAEVVISGPDGERQLPVGDLYSGNAKQPLNLARNEILTKLLVPLRSAKTGWAYRKLTLRGGFEFAALSVTAVLYLEDDGITCKDVRLAAGAVSAAPLRAQKAESQLQGKEVSDEIFSETAEIAAREIRIVAHHGFSTAYLKEALKVEAKRALKVAFERVA
jgi:4-hydroxybenzoyl-CoA reductase beta subunit